MQKSKLLVAVLGALFASTALAEEASSPATANVGLVNDYLFRGISRSGGKSAIQGGFDFAASSGLYVGAWGSSISFISDAGLAKSSSLELDTYAGIKNSFATDYTYDVGFVRYTFPGAYAAAVTSPDTNEAYGALAYKWLAVKYSYSTGNTFGVANAKGSNYLNVSINYPVPDSGFILGAHYGKQTYKGPNAGTGIGSLSHNDYKVSIAYDISEFVFTVAYSRTNTAKGVGAAYNVLGNDLGHSATVLSLSRTF